MPEMCLVATIERITGSSVIDQLLALAAPSSYSRIPPPYRHGTSQTDLEHLDPQAMIGDVLCLGKVRYVEAGTPRQCDLRGHSGRYR
jgi:hypothetical protein